jgi:hypothetical protein
MSQELALLSLQEALSSLQNKDISVASFCRKWRAQTTLLTSLPSRYGQVMEDLLGRLEAGSLFTEESCSFSQEDLHANLTMWLDKVNQQISDK